jgi:hypothetical protein
VLAAVLALAAAVLAIGVGMRPAYADGTFSLSSASYTVSEGDPVSITINRSGGTQNVQVGITITDGTATAGTHYVHPGITSYIFTVPGSNSFSFNISTIEDLAPNANRTFSVTISVPSGSSVGIASATVTIVDDDSPPKYSFQAATSSVVEGNVTHRVAVVREGSTAGTDSVTCQLDTPASTAMQGAGNDYTFSNQPITFNPGETGPKYCNVSILDDVTTEPIETIVLTFGSASSGFGPGTHTTHTVTIIDNDGAGSIQFTSATYTGSEAGGPITITVSRTGGTVGAVTVGWSSAGTGAFPLTPGVDFNPVSGTLTWADGEGGTKSFTITPVLDLIPESTETATLSLAIQAGGAVLGSQSTATLLISDSTIIPVITSIVPNVGPTAGGQTVTINGQNFTGATSVTFGGTSCTSFTVVSATQITCVTPPRPAGVVEVIVTTPLGSNVTTGTANDYLYTSGPTVLSLTPSEGACNGATVVTVTGTGFTSSGMTVAFGTVQAVFTYISSTTLVAVAPVQGAGVVDVRVTTPAGTSPNTAADDFTCTGTPIPTVTGLNPTSGPIGTTVTITGTNFVGVTSVTFGGVSATFTVVSSTQITATVPAGTPPGVVDVRVTNAAGTSPNTSADNFTNTSTSTIQYTLYRTFTLIVWTGADNKPIAQAIGGTQSGTTNVSALIGAIWLFNPQTQTWRGYFPGTENVPGANDFTTFRAGTAYFIALRPTAPATVSWVAPAN